MFYRLEANGATFGMLASRSYLHLLACCPNDAEGRLVKEEGEEQGGGIRESQELRGNLEAEGK